MSNLAETILRDVPRYGTDPDDCDGFIPTPDGDWLDRDEVLAAITAAMNPALTERAGEVLSRLRKADEYEPLGHDGWEAADLITALLAQNAALRAERDVSNELGRAFEEDAGQQRERAEAAEAEVEKLRADVAFTATDGQRLLRKIDVIGVCDDPDLCFDSEGSVARCGPCAVKIAARDGVVLNQYTCSNPQAMRLRRELTAAEAQIAALTARVEGLTGALDKARTQDRDPDYVYDEEWEYTMRWDEWPDLVDGHDLTEPMPIYTLYKGPTKWVVQIPIDTDGDGETDDFETKLFDSEETARAALSTTEEGHE